jgi:hypothetical protein
MLMDFRARPRRRKTQTREKERRLIQTARGILNRRHFATDADYEEAFGRGLELLRERAARKETR